MIVDQTSRVTKISLERPASVRKFLPSLAQNGWLLPEYHVGSENEGLRYLFSEPVIENLAALSPIVLYGDRFVGKTALAITLAVTWSRICARRPLSFTTGRSFSQDFTAALEISDTDSFRTRTRDCQLLVIDDLDPIATAPAAQEELVHTLDQLALAERPVILSSQRLPSTIPQLSSTLSSRLTGGFSLQLQRPTGATVSDIALQLARTIDPKLDEQDILRLCNLFDSRPLTTLDLRNIVLLAHQTKSASGSVNCSAVKQLALQHMESDTPTLPSIAKVVARRLRVRLTEMRGATRDANIVRARGLAIHLARKLTPASLQQIGQFFGGRDHSTVLHASRKVENLIESDPELANLIRDIQADLEMATA
ncbi:helix-turn-helix domain-containing protein [Aureliella helgolandensis]|uniref:Chromosomal replication initiator protein DnaA n=1 Tax=Aureliella helgolandensis TaxID=2527968 RepID=A0A518FZD5_9BACT|nr:helix-turn-helix domain-containing protein [Aureliella helgolandensis]QDV21722.1 Chromosomal replication initiator protein DnaA [Aureliella helgolandensis]